MYHRHHEQQQQQLHPHRHPTPPPSPSPRLAPPLSPPPPPLPLSNSSSNSNSNHSPSSPSQDKPLPQPNPNHHGQDNDKNLDQLIQNLRAVYRAYHLEWIDHCEAMDRLRLRLSRKKRPTLTPVTSTVDLSIGIPIADSTGILSGSSTSTPITSLTATGRTTRRTANLTTFGIGDAVTDAQFDLVLAQLGTADQKDPNIRAMKTTAHVPDMALLPHHRCLPTTPDDHDTLISDPISFYQLINPSHPSQPDHDHQSISVWTEEEQDIFEKSYATQPKQFGWIASQLGTKTRAECVLHYYRTKRENKYRNLHSPPQPIAEGKARELRGKRSRKPPSKTPNDPTPTPTLKPKPKPPTPDNVLPTADEAEEESAEPTPTTEAPPAYPSDPAPKADLTQPPAQPEQSHSNHDSYQTPLDHPPSSQPNQFHETLQPRIDHSLSSTRRHSTNPISISLSPKSTTDSLEAKPVCAGPGFNLSTSVKASKSLTESNPSTTDNHKSVLPQPDSHLTTSHEPSSVPVSLASHPSSTVRQEFSESTLDSSKWPPRAHKKRKVQSIDISGSAFLPKVMSSSTNQIASPITSKPSSSFGWNTRESSLPNLNGSVQPSKPNNSDIASQPSEPGNESIDRLDQRSHQVTPEVIQQSESAHPEQHQRSRDTHPGVTATFSLPEGNQSPIRPSPPPNKSKPTEAPVIRSSMQIKNLLNDDPVEPSASMSNMDASAWFGNDSQQPSPTDEVSPSDAQPVNDNRNRPPQNVPPLERILLPPQGDYYLHPITTQQRPLSQPLSQPMSQSVQPLPRPLSRPLSRPSIHANLSQSSGSSLPPLSFHRPNQRPSELGNPIDYPGRHTEVMMVDDRFADPPSSPISSSSGHRNTMSTSRGHQDPPTTHEPPKAMPHQTRAILPHPTKYGRVPPQVQDRSNSTSDYHSTTAGPPLPHLQMPPHPQAQISSQSAHPRPASQASRAHLSPQSHSHLPSQINPSHMTPQSNHSQIPPSYPHATSQTSPRHMNSSQLRSPNSTGAPPGGPSHFSPIHSPAASPFNRLPPPLPLPSSTTASSNSNSSRHSSDPIQRPPSHHHHHVWAPSHHNVNNNPPNYHSVHPVDRMSNPPTTWTQLPHPHSHSHSHQHPHHHHHHHHQHAPTAHHPASTSVNYHHPSHPPHLNHPHHYPARNHSLSSQMSPLTSQDHPSPIDPQPPGIPPNVPRNQKQTNPHLHPTHPSSSHHHHHHRSSSGSSRSIDWDQKDR